MNKVLIVSYFFPPLGGGAVARIYSFVKYLPRLGWQPTVLTVREDWYRMPIQDSSLKVSNSLKVVRTGSWEPKGQISRIIRANPLGAAETSLWFARILRGILKMILELVVIPDEQVLWIPFALKEGLKLLSRNKIVAVLITTPPHSVWILGYLLKKIGRIPLVIDVRDDWVGNPLFRPKYAYRILIERVVERRVVHSSDAIICATEESYVLFREKYPDCPFTKFQWIPNGYDPEEYIESFRNRENTDRKSNEKLRLIYAGGLPKGRTPEYFFRALKELRHKLQDDNYLEIEFCGFMRNEFQQMIYDMNIEDLVKITGFVPRSECIQRMIRADVGVVIIPFEEGSMSAIPGKIYEYMACDRFILCLADKDSAVANFVRQENIGIVASPHDVEDIMNALKHILDMFRHKTLTRRFSENLKLRFNRMRHSEQLSDLLLHVVNQ